MSSKANLLNMKKAEVKKKGCLVRCCEPIVCSCYTCLVGVLVKVFLSVCLGFLVYWVVMHYIRGMETKEVLKNILKMINDFVWSLF